MSHVKARNQTNSKQYVKISVKIKKYLVRIFLKNLIAF